MKQIALLLILPLWVNGKTHLDTPSFLGIWKNGESLSLEGNTIKLNNTDNLVLLFPSQPGDIAYVYELQDSIQKGNADQDTLMSTNLPVIAYSSLKKGHYILKASVQKKGEGVQELIPINIIVKNQVINDWWFLVLLVFYLLLLLGGALFFIRLSSYRHQEKLATLRSDWTNKLHNDIGGDLSSVSLRLDILKRKMEPLDTSIKESVLKTYGVLKSIQRKLRFVFDLVDPKKDSLLIMLADVRDFAAENCAMQNIDFDYQNGIAPEAGKNIDIGRINKLYLAMKEAVNNCVKNSEASQASLIIRQERKGLFVEVKDNGKGFDPSIQHNGNGVENLKAYSIEGLIDVAINSEKGKGTSVQLFVPNL